MGNGVVRLDIVVHMVIPVIGVIHGTLGYDPSNPLEVTLTLRAGGSNGDVVRWGFARSLLRDGLMFDVGLGDVKLSPVATPNGRVIILTISGVDAHDEESSMMLSLSWHAVEYFLAGTYAEVPPATERRLVADSVDTIIRQCLGV